MGYHQFEPLLVLSAMCLAGTQLSKQRGDVRTSAGPNLWGGASEMPPVRRVDRSGSGGVWCKYLGGPNGLKCPLHVAERLRCAIAADNATQLVSQL